MHPGFHILTHLYVFLCLLFLICSESPKVQLQQSKDVPIVYGNYKVMLYFKEFFDCVLLQLLV